MFYNIADDDFYQDYDTAYYQGNGDDVVGYHDDYDGDDNDNDAKAFVDSDGANDVDTDDVETEDCS